MKNISTFIKNKKSMANKGLLVFTLAVLFLGCQSKTEVTIAPQDLILTVYGIDGKPQPNAQVALFDNRNTFYTQNSTFGTNGAVRLGITDVEGGVKFDSLRTDVNYYVLAYTIDSSKFINEGYRIYNDNSRTGFEFLQKLNKSSTTYASVDLLPAEALVSFYADNFNNEAIPVNIFVGSNKLGSINLIRTTTDPVPLNPSSNPIQNGVISTKIRLGLKSESISFVNNYQCLVIPNLNVIPGGFTPLNVNQCDNGGVSFWTSVKNDIHIPIIVTLNSVVDTLKTVSIRTPTDFNSPNVLSKSIEVGNYIYYAISKGKNCIWQGSFAITKKEIKFIELPIEQCK